MVARRSTCRLRSSRSSPRNVCTSAVYCDIIERVKALEKLQRQPAGGNPRPTPTPAQPQNGATRVSKRFPLVRDQPVWETSTSQSPQPRKGNFPRPARSCSSPTVEQRRNFRGSAPTCSLRTPGRPHEVAPARYEVFAPGGITPTHALRSHWTPARTPFAMTPNGPSPRKSGCQPSSNYSMAASSVLSASSQQCSTTGDFGPRARPIC